MGEKWEPDRPDSAETQAPQPAQGTCPILGVSFDFEGYLAARNSLPGQANLTNMTIWLLFPQGRKG
jgi:hypothetical protein